MVPDLAKKRQHGIGYLAIMRSVALPKQITDVVGDCPFWPSNLTASRAPRQAGCSAPVCPLLRSLSVERHAHLFYYIVALRKQVTGSRYHVACRSGQLAGQIFRHVLCYECVGFAVPQDYRNRYR